MSPRTPLKRFEKTAALVLCTLALVLAASSCTSQHDTCEAWRAAAERRSRDVKTCSENSSCRLTLDDIELESWAHQRADRECSK